MKIALLTNGIYPFNIGGMQKHSYYLAKYFSKCNIDVDIYYFRSKNSKNYTVGDYFKPEELKYLTFYELEFPLSPYFPGHYVYNSFKYSCNIYRRLQKRLTNIDYIYVQGFTGWKLLKEKKLGRKLPPIGLNFHGLEMYQIAANMRSKLEQYLFRWPVTYCLKNADIAYSLGGQLTNILKKRVAPSTIVLETPIGIEEKWLNKNIQPSNERRKFIFVGRYDRRKGIQELNKVIKRIHDTYEFDFEFIGPIPQKHRLELSNCTYHGSIYGEDKIIEIISSSDILVCPSYSEGMPTVILEAMSRGLAVIATDVGAVSELVSAETGWLVKPANLADLENAIIKAISLSKKRLTSKRETAFELIKNKFTWDKVIKDTLSQIENEVNGNITV